VASVTTTHVGFDSHWLLEVTLVGDPHPYPLLLPIAVGGRWRETPPSNPADPVELELQPRKGPPQRLVFLPQRRVLLLLGSEAEAQNLPMTQVAIPHLPTLWADGHRRYRLGVTEAVAPHLTGDQHRWTLLTLEVEGEAPRRLLLEGPPYVDSPWGVYPPLGGASGDVLCLETTDQPPDWLRTLTFGEGAIQRREIPLPPPLLGDLVTPYRPRRVTAPTPEVYDHEPPYTTAFWQWWFPELLRGARAAGNGVVPYRYATPYAHPPATGESDPSLLLVAAPLAPAEHPLRWHPSTPAPPPTEVSGHWPHRWWGGKPWRPRFRQRGLLLTPFDPLRRPFSWPIPEEEYDLRTGLRPEEDREFQQLRRGGIHGGRQLRRNR